MSEDRISIETLVLIARTHGAERLTQVEPLLCDAFGALEVKLQDANGGNLHGDTCLRNAIRDARSVMIRLPWPPIGDSPDGVADQSDDALRADGSADAGNAKAPPPQAMGGTETEDGIEARFIIEFDRLERQNRFMWAGFVVKELLPQLGLGPTETKPFLRRLEADGLVITTREPNPKNPDFPTTRVSLYRDHPRVQAVLRSAGTRPPRIRFPDGGECVSDLLIRERR